ncbi:MAG TPA: SEC-C domain-containing protein [Isosphaeraceae bacterium]|nr:SEC-C domain-containing protein [Isosphaeraceae bacterium]
MEPEDRKSDAKRRPVGASDLVESARKDPLDAGILVQQMVEGGKWPAPELLERIVNAGNGAVGPLLDVLRAKPPSRPEPHVLRHVMGLLSVLRPPEAITELVHLVEHGEEVASADAADALGQSGDAGFEALIKFCSSASFKGYRRSYVFDAAAFAALDNRARKSRLAEVLHPILEDTIAKAQEELKRVGWLKKNPPIDDLVDDDEFDEFDEDDDEVISDIVGDEEHEIESEAYEDSDPDTTGDEEDIDDDLEEEFDVETSIAEEVAFVVGAMAIIADPAARDTIMTAFREGLVDESTTSKKRVDEHYAEAEEPIDEGEVEWNWLDSYRADYEEMGHSAPPAHVPRTKYRYEDRYDEGEPPPDIPAIAPIRNTQPKLGRNDPCWCGSGKKFKKCHLGKDGGSDRTG